MNRVRRLRSLALVGALALAIANAPAASARGPVSYNNPYRSFNISGVNYGSMRWERQQRRGSHSISRTRAGGLWRHRR